MLTVRKTTDPDSSAASGRFARTHRSSWEWLQVVLLAANLVWTTLCLGGFRSETMVVTASLNGLLLTVHLLAHAFERDGGGRHEEWGGFHPAGWWLLPFLVYAGINVLVVSPVPWLGWRDWLLWAQAIAVFWVVLNGVRSATPRAALWSVLFGLGVISVVLAAYQRFVNPAWLMLGRTQVPYFYHRSSGPFGIPNSLAAFLLLLVPPAAALAWRRGSSAVQRVLSGYLALLYLAGIVLTISRGAWLSLAVVAVGAPLFAARRSLGRRLVLAGAVLGLLVASLSIAYRTLPLARIRLEALRHDAGEVSRPVLWRAAWQIFRENPLWGGGAGSFNVRFEKYRPEGFNDEPLWAHNDYLNTLSDYGLTGLGLLFGGCFWIGYRSWKKPGAGRRDESQLAPMRRLRGWSSIPRGAVTCGLVAFALHLSVDFHLKIPALAMAFATLAAFWVQGAPAPRPSGEQRLLPHGGLGRTACGVVGCIVAFGTAGWVVPLYRAEASRAAARAAIDGLATRQIPVSEWPAVLKRSQAKLERAVEMDPRNSGAWADLSYVRAANTRFEPAQAPEIGRAADEAAQRALAGTRLVPEFWVRHGVALDLQGRWVEAGAAFVEALRLAPANARAWFYEAAHLSRDETDPGRTRSAVDFSLRLDPGNREAQALRQRLAERSRAP